MQLLNSIKAAKIHGDIMNDLHDKHIVVPGNSINNIVDYIENSIFDKINYDSNIPLTGGCAFPVNISVNEIVAHYTSSSKNDDYILKKNDIVKVDFGVHKNGSIIDSAQTFHFDSKYDEFVEYSKKCTDYAVSLCGPDVNLGDLGKDIEEYVKSKEIHIDNKLYQLHTLKELSGHNIGEYLIHKSKALPNCAIKYPVRMEEGDFFAVEPFISTCAESYYDSPTNLFMVAKNYNNLIYLLCGDELELFNKIIKQYLTLCFCDKWLEKDIDKFDFNIFKNIIDKKIIEEYKTIYVLKDNYVSQFEHNVYIKSNGIIQLTKNKYY